MQIINVTTHEEKRGDKIAVSIYVTRGLKWKKETKERYGQLQTQL